MILQYMRRDDTFLPHLGSLRHPETMLLVDHGEPERTEPYILLNQRMCAHKNLQRPVEQVSMDLAPSGGSRASRKQSYPDAEPSGPGADCLVMLGRENLRRGHYRSLETIVESHEDAHEGHHGLSAPHIALQQTVHLTPAAHIIAYLLEHTLLRAGELKRKFPEIEIS